MRSGNSSPMGSRLAAAGLRRPGLLVKALALSGCVMPILSGCLMPSRGTPVLVDQRAGDFWSGRGQLIEVSEDRSRCRVAVRDESLIVVKLWIDCAWIHPRHERS